MSARFFIDRPLRAGEDLALPDGPARHAQVLRLQPGATVRLFDGSGGEWRARIVRMGGRSHVDVAVEAAGLAAVDRELATEVVLALGMPANDRMEAVIEKATELGVAAIQPLICERSVLRLDRERADKKVAHWQAVAIAACEQCGRTRLPRIRPVASLRDWLQAPVPASTGDDATERWLLSLRDDAAPVASRFSAHARRTIISLSGPEGGLTGAEEDDARRLGFAPVSLGSRVLRADTAPLALLSYLALASPPS